MTKTKDKSHPIRNSVVGGLILAAILGICSLIPGGWHFVFDCVRAVLSWFSSPISIPIWVFSFLVITCVGGLIFIVIQFLSTITVETHFSYVTDTFLGLRWRWRYSGSEISCITCFCPSCDLQLYPRKLSLYDAVDHIGFKCEDCNRDLAEFQFSYDHLEDKILRSIQKNLRNDSWKEKIEKS